MRPVPQSVGIEREPEPVYRSFSTGRGGSEETLPFHVCLIPQSIQLCQERLSKKGVIPHLMRDLQSLIEAGDAGSWSGMTKLIMFLQFHDLFGQPHSCRFHFCLFTSAVCLIIQSFKLSTNTFSGLRPKNRSASSWKRWGRSLT